MNTIKQSKEHIMKPIKFIIENKKAVIPTKAHSTDIGYDLTAINIYKKISEHVSLYDTGIKVIPPDGYYIEIVPRSSISKTGYMLANSVGTIDPDYTGTLKIALIKVDTSMPDITIPFKLCQMILRKAERSYLEEVFNLNKTIRGDGGFGSSDLKKN